MKYKKWIIFRLSSGIVHWIWNGEYPILVTAPEDLSDDIASYAWCDFIAKNIDEVSYQTLFHNLENSRHKKFSFNGYNFEIVARGEFQEP